LHCFIELNLEEKGIKKRMFNLGLKRSLIEEIRHIFLFDLFIEDNFAYFSVRYMQRGWIVEPTFFVSNITSKFWE